MDQWAESIVIVLAVGLSLTMVAAAVGKGLRLLPPQLWPNGTFREGNLLVVPELCAVFLELGLVWLLWTAPAFGFIGSAALFSGFNLYLAWLVSRGVKRCNCFGPPTAITQNKLAVNYGVTIGAVTGAAVAGPASSVLQCGLGLLALGGFIAFVWSSRYVARRQEFDSLREPPAVGVSIEETGLAPHCMIVFVTFGCSGCDLVLDRVRQLDGATYPRYGVIDATTPDLHKPLAASKIVESGLTLVEDPLGTLLQEQLSVHVFPSVVGVDNWVSTTSGISVDGLMAAHEKLLQPA